MSIQKSRTEELANSHTKNRGQKGFELGGTSMANARIQLSPTSWKVFFIGLHDLPGEYTCLRLAHPMTKGETKEPQPVTNRITPRLNWSWSTTTTTKKGYIYKRKTGDVATGRDYQSPPLGKGLFRNQSPRHGDLFVDEKKILIMT